MAEWLVDFGGAQPVKITTCVSIGILPGAVYANALMGKGVRTLMWDPVDVVSKPQTDAIQTNLILSLEAFNTFNPDHNKTIVANIVAGMRPGCTLIWSSGQPGAVEKHFINLLPKQYWVDLFVKAGLKHCVVTEKRLTDYVAAGKHVSWLLENVLIFQNQAVPVI